MERAPDRTPLIRVLVALLAAVLVPVSTARAQEVPGLTITAAGGWSIDADLTPGLENVNTVLEPGWVAALQLEHYFGTGMFGLRLDGAYTVRYLDDDSGKFNVWTADLGGVFRPPVLRSVRVLDPFLALTAGATMYQAASGSPTFAEGRFGPDPVFRAHATVSGGMDFLVLPQLAVRLEVGDRMIFPSVGFSPEADGFPVAHTAVGLLGLQYRFGVGGAPAPRPRRPERAREPEPEPEPQPEPEPEPEPEPAQPVQEPEPAPTPEPAPAEAAEAAVFTVQVSTFLTPSTARRWGERIQAQGVPVWYMDRQLGGTDVSRVRAGATTTEARAREIAAFITAEFGWDATVERIGPEEPVPSDALARTLEFLGGR